MRENPSEIDGSFRGLQYGDDVARLIINTSSCFETEVAFLELEYEQIGLSTRVISSSLDRSSPDVPEGTEAGKTFS